MADKKIEQYCKEVADEFVNKYLEELDNNIYKMLNAFGFQGCVDDSGEWLDNNGYKLSFDEDFIDADGIKTKSIYLVDNMTNCVIGIFFVRTYLEDGNLCYQISDVFINRINEGE